MKIAKISSDEYLEMCAGKIPVPDGVTLSVEGDIKLHGHPLSQEIECLIPAVVEGDVRCSGECALKDIHCWVSGSIALSKARVRSVSPEIGTTRASKAIEADGCLELMEVKGWFVSANLSGTGIVSLGEDFACDGGLRIEGCKNIAEINCSVGTLHAGGCSVSRVGPQMMAKTVFLDRCENLKEVGEIKGLDVSSFDGSGVERVLPTFSCGRNASFSGCRSLKHLSGRFGEMRVSMARLETIDNVVAETASFTGCELPARVRGALFERLNLEECDWERIPDGVAASKCLSLKSCGKFYELPKRLGGGLVLDGLDRLAGTPEGFGAVRLHVRKCGNFGRIRGVIGGDCVIEGGTPKLIELGSDLEIRGNLMIAPEADVKKLDCSVGANVAAGLGKVEETGVNFRVGGTVNFRSCTALKSPKGLVMGNADFAGSSVNSLGADFECQGDLCLDGTGNLASLNCTVGGSVGARWSCLKKTGPAFFCGKDFSLKSHKEMFEEFKGTVEGEIKIDEMSASRLKKTGKFRPSPLPSPQLVPPEPTLPLPLSPASPKGFSAGRSISAESAVAQCSYHTRSR